jgi:hypothetical protein
VFLRLITFVLAMSIFTVHADVGSQQSLKSAFDDLNYSLSVEWDQKDRAFYDAKVGEFTKQLTALQAQGLTNAELVDFVKANLKDKALAKDLETAYTLISLNKLSKEEARKLVLDTTSKAYSKGASWAGEVLLYSAVIVLIIVAAVAFGGTVTVSPGPRCYDEYVCVDYYDGWGWYWYTDCYYQTYCY